MCVCGGGAQAEIYGPGINTSNSENNGSATPIRVIVDRYGRDFRWSELEHGARWENL